MKIYETGTQDVGQIVPQWLHHPGETENLILVWYMVQGAGSLSSSNLALEACQVFRRAAVFLLGCNPEEVVLISRRNTAATG